MPRQARAGELLEVRTMIQHSMETGYRVDSAGHSIARDIVRRFECRFAGALVCGADLHAAVAANPYLAFWFRASTSGRLEFLWRGDQGFEHRESLDLTVT
jgi:sulfur-oxidizing protein SoxZ